MGRDRRPNVDTHAHLVRAEPETWMGEGEGWLYEAQEATGEIDSVEEDKHLHVEL